VSKFPEYVLERPWSGETHDLIRKPVILEIDQRCGDVIR